MASCKVWRDGEWFCMLRSTPDPKCDGNYRICKFAKEEGVVYEVDGKEVVICPYSHPIGDFCMVRNYIKCDGENFPTCYHFHEAHKNGGIF